MAWVKEFSGAIGTSNTLQITVPAGGVTAGHFLALGLASSSQTAAPTWTVTDSRQNSWTINPTYGKKTVTGSFDTVALATCVLATTLQAGDIITATSSTGTVTRLAGSVEEFADVISGIDIGSTGDNGGVSTTAVTSGSFTTNNASELLVGAVCMVSAGRTYTPTAPWSGGTKVATTVGTAERAVVVQWQSVSATGTYASSGTFNTGAIFAAVGAGYSISTGGARSGNAKVWNGSAWVGHPAKVWNGSAWVAHQAKGWNGSTWTVGK
jgi:hypothetical protein